jgi:hypothetical protein
VKLPDSVTAPATLIANIAPDVFFNGDVPFLAGSVTLVGPVCHGRGRAINIRRGTLRGDESTMSVFNVQLALAERSLRISVLMFTVLAEPEFVSRVGVVTKVPYQVTCRGSVTTIYRLR